MLAFVPPFSGGTYIWLMLTRILEKETGWTYVFASDTSHPTDELCVIEADLWYLVYG